MEYDTYRRFIYLFASVTQEPKLLHYEALKRKRKKPGIRGGIDHKVNININAVEFRMRGSTLEDLKIQIHQP